MKSRELITTLTIVAFFLPMLISCEKEEDDKLNSQVNKSEEDQNEPIPYHFTYEINGISYDNTDSSILDFDGNGNQRIAYSIEPKDEYPKYYMNIMVDYFAEPNSDEPYEWWTDYSVGFKKYFSADSSVLYFSDKTFFYLEELNDSTATIQAKFEYRAWLRGENDTIYIKNGSFRLKDKYYNLLN